MAALTQPWIRASVDPCCPVDAIPFTGTDDVEYEVPIVAMIPDGAGTVKVTTIKGTTVILTVLAGVRYDLRIVAVFDVDTTVSGVFLTAG